MASLAPGNGWFPHRTPGSSKSTHAERPRTASSNVYAFPAARWQPSDRKASGSALANRLAALLMAESLKTGRTVNWVLGWCMFSAVLASLVWLGLAGVLVAAALLIGIPWMTVAIAATLTQLLGTMLVVLMCRRIGRGLLLSMDKRRHLPQRNAA
jgi:hypothetical protein